jgi:hypothetical protein
VHRERQRGARALHLALRRRVCRAQRQDAPAVPRGPQAAFLQQQAGSPACRREAVWSQHPAELVQESETGFPRPAAWRASALPQAQVGPVSARRWVQRRAAWRRRAALPFAHRAATSEWLVSRVQQVALPRMELRAVACVPAERQSGARAAACARAEPRLAASVRAALVPAAASDARAAQPRAVAASVGTERQPEAVPQAARARQPVAVGLAVPVQQAAAAVVSVALEEQRPAARRDAARHQEAARLGAAAVQAASARQRAVLASAAASAFRRGRVLPSVPLAPRRAARFAHAMRSSLAASPSMRSWQAARGEGLSSWQGPGKGLGNGDW